MPEWTADQKKAIESVGKGTVVSAAAGSGKTAVLIERTIRILSDESLGVTADTLLAVTFTNDAAAQMRNKLNSAFEKKIAENPENEWLTSQRQKLSLAKITTINAFCLDLVKSNLNRFDFQSGLRILDETELKLIEKKALDTVLEKNYEQSPDRMRLLIDSMSTSGADPVGENIKNLYKFLRSQPFPEQWIDNVIKSYDSPQRRQRLQNDVTAAAKAKMKAAEKALNEAKLSLKAVLYHPSVNETVEANLKLCKSLVDTLERGEWDAAVQAFSEVKFGTMRTALAAKNQAEFLSSPYCELEQAAIEYIKKQRETFKSSVAACAAMFSYTQSQIDYDLRKSKKVLVELYEIEKEFAGEVLRIKKDKNAVDFADVEIMSINLLVDGKSGELKRTELAEEIIKSKAYRLIVIDEFQDVNNLQNLIFKALSDSESPAEMGSNMFIVGDAKQSIYRFRLANPQIFVTSRYEASRDENKDKLTEVILKSNFRSRKNVIDFTNFVFENLMSAEIGETEYNDDERLVKGASYPDVDIPTEILIYDDNTDSSENDDDGDSECSAEYVQTAKKIRSMIDSGVTVTENGAERKCRQSDFCVLARNNLSRKMLSDAFERYGLNAAAEGLDGYLKSKEISLMLSILSVIDNPMHDISMAAVLLSPVFMFTDDELAQIKLINTESKLYQNILAGAQNERKIISTQLSEKCDFAERMIKKLRLYAASLPLGKLIEKIYDATDILSLTSVYRDSKQKRANLMLFREYAASYENGVRGGITGFLRYIKFIGENGEDFKQALTSFGGEDSVSVKTIHRSKGLEYPFVFLCGFSKKFNLKELNGRMLISEKAGIGFSLYEPGLLMKYTTLPYDVIRMKIKNELLSEEMRLLYVALTRARERLFITYRISADCIKRLTGLAVSICNENGISAEIVKSASSMQDWISMCLLVHPGGDFFRNLAESDLRYPIYKTESGIKICSAEKNEQKRAETLKSEDTKQSSAVKNDIKMIIGYKYDDSLVKADSKLTVTELVKNNDSAKFYPALPRFTTEFDELTAAEKGTALHRFMERADYSLAARDVKEELKRLMERGVFSQKQAESIDTQKLSAFFSSVLYKRIEKSPKVFREKKFIVRISEIEIKTEELKVYENTDGMLQGIADCVFEEHDGYVLVDYKTDRVKSIETLKERYSAQLEMYKAALNLLLEKPVKECVIYSFSLGNAAVLDL